MKLKLQLTLLLSAVSLLVNAQVLPDSTVNKIDQLFSNKVNEESPGFTVGVVQNDTLVFSKGYGMANLEYGIQNRPETIYHMASVSKQFTAFCILLLEKKGLLKLEDDIHKHLSWFPDVKQKITILHLLNHTSGIRDHWDLNMISGRRMDDVITQDYLLTLLSRQRALNFTPGEEFSYSNSNFTLLAEIVKAVSGQSFRQFADSAIFKPLGMRATHFHDDHTEVVANRSYSYRPLNNVRYANMPLNYANAGATSLFTNVFDMAKWVANFYHPKVGDASVLRKLTTNGVLNNGRKLSYAAGISVDEYNGKKRFSHAGGDAGYRTFVSVFPNEKMGFIVFSNLATADIVGKTNSLTDLFFKPLPPVEKKTIDSSLARFADTVSIAKFMGNYLSYDGIPFSYRLKDNQVYWTSPTASYLLARGQNDTLVSVNNPDVKFVFSKSPSNEVVVDQYWPDNHRKLTKYTPLQKDSAQLEKDLQQYVGQYYSAETDISYTLSLKGRVLEMSSSQSFTVKNPLTYLHTDLFRRGNAVLRFKRDSKNGVTGFEFNTNRTRNLLFTRRE